MIVELQNSMLVHILNISSNRREAAEGEILRGSNVLDVCP